MRINREIRAKEVRLIGHDGAQLGIVSFEDALSKAQDADLDLVEVAESAKPPVCKITDYGKLRYMQTKKERIGRKGQQQGKLKEVKVKPNISDHDFGFKLRHARDFLQKGCKVKVTCMFRGREMAHKEVGMRVVQRMVNETEDVGTPEAPLKMMGRNLITILAPGVRKRKVEKAPTETPKPKE